MDDSISRQAVIDAIIPAMVEGADAELIEGILYLFPSVQPIIRCHECAKRRTLDCPMGITVFDAPPSDGYCYKAERKE